MSILSTMAKIYTPYLYGSLLFDCTQTVVVHSEPYDPRRKKRRGCKTENKEFPTRRSMRIMNRVRVIEHKSASQENGTNVQIEVPKKRRYHRSKPTKSKKTIKQKILQPVKIGQPSKVAASLRKVPEKILNIDYNTNDVLIKWKNINTPEFLDITQSIPPNVLQLILEFKSNPAPVVDTTDIREAKVELAVNSIALYRREQRIAVPDNFRHTTCHIKTE